MGERQLELEEGICGVVWNLSSNGVTCVRIPSMENTV